MANPNIPSHEKPQLLASDFHPEALRLFDRYVHGAIDRRGFLDAAAKVAALAGVTASGLLDALKPRFVEAQQVAADDKRIRTQSVEFASPQGNGKVRAYVASPAKHDGKLPVAKTSWPQQVTPRRSTAATTTPRRASTSSGALLATHTGLVSAHVAWRSPTPSLIRDRALPAAVGGSSVLVAHAFEACTRSAAAEGGLALQLLASLIRLRKLSIRLFVQCCECERCVRHDSHIAAHLVFVVGLHSLELLRLARLALVRIRGGVTSSRLAHERSHP